MITMETIGSRINNFMEKLDHSYDYKTVNERENIISEIKNITNSNKKNVYRIYIVSNKHLENIKDITIEFLKENAHDYYMSNDPIGLLNSYIKDVNEDSLKHDQKYFLVDVTKNILIS